MRYEKIKKLEGQLNRDSFSHLLWTDKYVFSHILFNITVFRFVYFPAGGDQQVNNIKTRKVPN